MKNNYILLWLLSLFAFTHVSAQVCPGSLGNSSTTTLIHFKISANSCNDYPASISVEGNTFDQISCNGTNLKYQLSSGSPLTIFDAFSADFGSGMMCNYLDGILRDDTLSIDQISNEFDDLKVYPNPLIQGNEINVRFSQNVSVKLYVYDISGKIVMTQEITNAFSEKLNISGLNNGIYLLKIEGDHASISRKIVIMK